MPLADKFVCGRILWVALPDKQGSNPKRCPVVLLHDATRLPEDASLVVAAVTHSFDEPLPDYQFRLPHSNSPQSRPMTGLSQPSAVDCTWRAFVSRRGLVEDDVGGIVPPTILEQVLARIRQPPPPDPPPA